MKPLPPTTNDRQLWRFAFMMVAGIFITLGLFGTTGMTCLGWLNLSCTGLAAACALWLLAIGVLCFYSLGDFHELDQTPRNSI